MSRWDKLLNKLSKLSYDIRFEELEKILKQYGYRMENNGGSHCVFRKPGEPPITVPKHKRIKRVYIEMVRNVVDKEKKGNENN